MAISSRGEQLLFKLSSFMVMTKLLVVAALGLSMIGMWHLYNVGALPPAGRLIKRSHYHTTFYINFYFVLSKH